MCNLTRSLPRCVPRISDQCKNERLAWRKKPRTYCRCFSSCPKRHCKGRPFQLQIRKKQLFRPRKVVFYFPSRHSWEQALSFSGAFSSSPKLHYKGRPFQFQLEKKNNFSGPEKLFFISPSRHSLEQALSFSGAFSSCPKRHCKGRPFQFQLEKKQLFRARKVVFYFPFQTLLGAGTKLFRCLFQLPKAALQRKTLPIAN